MDAEVERVVRLTLESIPRDATHWSTRTMAQRCGLSQTAVSRIWGGGVRVPGGRLEIIKPHTSPPCNLLKY